MIANITQMMLMMIFRWVMVDSCRTGLPLCEKMTGCEHIKEKIAGRISAIGPGDYFGRVSPEELTGLFF